MPSMRIQICIFVVVLLGLCLLVSETPAAIIPTDDVSPDPINYLLVFSNRLYVGEDSAGSLVVNGGTLLETDGGTVGRRQGASGSVTITGAGSTWDSTFVTSPTFYVGREGHGDLLLTTGGRLLSGVGRIASESTGTGIVTIADEAEWINEGLYVGDSNRGELYLSAGGKVTSTGNGRIGNEAGSTGVAQVAGSDTWWENTEYLLVGNEGNGRLEILEGAKVTNTHSNVAARSGTEGHVVVRGEGSEWLNSSSLRIGASALGTANASLTIDQGGYVESAEFATLATSRNTTTAVVVDGLGSAWHHNGDLQVGVDGQATMDVTGGAVHTNVAAFVGFALNADGKVRVAGENSLWQSTEQLSVGANSPGMLTVSDKARVETPMLLVGTSARGEVQVTGKLTHVEVDEDAFLGGFGAGHGVLTIDDRASVEIDGDLSLGFESTSKGEILVDNESKLEVRGVTTLGTGANTYGSLIIRAEAEVDLYDDLILAQGDGSIGTLRIETDGVLNMHGEQILVGDGNSNIHITDGTLKNTGVFGTSLNQTGGTLAAGNSPGTMQILGDYDLGGQAILEVELAEFVSTGGTPGVDFDFYQVGGAATLLGTLDVLADGGYVPQPGDTFEVLAANSIDASALQLSGLAGFSFEVVSISSGSEVLVLNYVPEPASFVLLASAMLFVSSRKQRSECSQIHAILR